jgi:hypothetical protein
LVAFFFAFFAMIVLPIHAECEQSSRPPDPNGRPVLCEATAPRPE